MTYPMPAPLSWCDVHLWRTRNRATEWEATQAGNTGGERERAKDKQSAEQSCKMRQDGGAASQLGRHTLPSPRQLRQRCSRVVPHPGQAQCTTPPASPPSPAAAGLLRRRSCLSDTGCRQRMMALPMHTWQLMKPLASQTEHLVATAILRCRRTRLATDSATPLTAPVTNVRVTKVPAPAPTAVSRGERMVSRAAATGGGGEVPAG